MVSGKRKIRSGVVDGVKTSKEELESKIIMAAKAIVLTTKHSGWSGVVRGGAVWCGVVRRVVKGFEQML